MDFRYMNMYLDMERNVVSGEYMMLIQLWFEALFFMFFLWYDRRDKKAIFSGSVTITGLGMLRRMINYFLEDV